MIQNKYRPKKKGARMAASAVEFALVAPLMIAFTFGLVELGRMMLVKQTATHASREGARIAVRPTATTSEVVERVNDELALMGIENATVETVPSSIETATPSGIVTVRIAIDISSITWVPGFLDLDATQIIAESSMRRESTN
ncbi:TadE family protein [Rhodopirellula maiorica SM1]|uniref:TadE family protein n=1 Tax=Rhodopirellula maiorica SM1 TaxID=1265738 RepID=M5RPL0_9BACT|nr:TadE family protein [Rhodopirellula maiorica]EMI21156.1 TadE family protein [Rhodopirellula maiorica SM1]